MTPSVLELLWALDVAHVKDKGRFLVARDAAHEAGCRLRVLNGRKVNIKKSNRRKPMPIARSSYDLWAGNPPDYRAGRQMTIEQNGPQFFEFSRAPSVDEPAGRTVVYDNREWRGMTDAIDRQDRADAEALAAAINAPPRMLGLLEQVSRADLEQRYTRNAAMRGDVQHVTLPPVWSPGLWWTTEWESERIFRELQREALFVSDGYRIGRSLEQPIILSRSRKPRGLDVRPTDPRSRVPAKLQQRRLDGRRR